jgi:hypothetical protein
MKTIAFFVRHFLERGTEVASYDYANYNETILGNKSYIIAFSKEKRKEMGWPCEDVTYDKFKSRFTLLEIEDIKDITIIIDEYKIDVFHTLVYGTKADEYKFEDKTIWKGCKTIKHCVFDTTCPESDYYCSISDYLNKKYNTNVHVFPHMIYLPETSETFRDKLGIPSDATVFGGYGGANNFNIEYVKKVVYEVAKEHPHIYFLFANFKPFCDSLPNIIHLPCILDPTEKSKFINTCDAMIWGRQDGEIMSIAQGEFSIKNKPIICSPVGDLGHYFTLQRQALWYTNQDNLRAILTNFNRDEMKKYDWNAYKEYTPLNVMNRFKMILDSFSSS